MVWILDFIVNFITKLDFKDKAYNVLYIQEFKWESITFYFCRFIAIHCCYHKFYLIALCLIAFSIINYWIINIKEF